MKLAILKNTPLQLFLCLIFALTIADLLPTNYVSYAYTISSVIKDLLMHFLPILVFSYIASALGAFKSRGFALIVMVLICICLSNALTVIAGYGLSSLILPSITNPSLDSQSLKESAVVINSLWELPIKPFIPTDKTMLVGAVIGLLLGLFPIKQVSIVIFKLRDFSTTVFRKFFTPLLPLFILGFLLKIAKEDVLWPLIQQYTGVFIFTCIALVVYLAVLYMIAASGNFTVFKNYLKTMLPAGITGFSTVSSAATMPVTIDATERNLNDRNYADFVIPSTVNVHLIGDGIGISITAIALMIMSGAGIPDFAHYLIFVLYYCLAKFSCAAVPGGGVLVLIPVFQSYLGMSNETASLLASIYILQDPIITSANVMGNGVFAILTHRIANFLK
jgi:Na+/H+-dicarboxylate symporter